MRGSPGWRNIAPFLCETTLLVSMGLLAFIIRYHSLPASPNERTAFILKGLLIALTLQAFLYLRDVYDFRKSRGLSEFLVRLGQALLSGSAVLWMLYYVLPEILVGRVVFAINLALSSVFLMVWHTTIRLVLEARRTRCNILVLGTEQLARTVVREVHNRPELGFKVQGFIDDNPAMLGISIVNPKVIGAHKDIPRIVQEHAINRVVVALQDRRGKLPTNELLELKTRGVEIEDATSFYERVTGKIATENLKPSWIIFNSGFEVCGRRLLLKHTAEFIVSLLVLIASAPLILIAIPAIKLDSPGPVFHKQKRVGREGRIFTLWKFRSMFKDAETETGPVWAEKDDKRVTRVGRILRRTRFDEIPQLFSVLRGDMSLVGPRPERPEFVQELEVSIPYYQIRQSVKPGVTGWAQINNGYANTVENTIEKLQYDLYYIKNMSPQLDAFITLETIKTCLSLRGI